MIPTLQSFIWYGFQPGYNDSFMFKFNQIWKNANLLYKIQWDIVIVYKQIQISKPWFLRTPYYSQCSVVYCDMRLATGLSSFRFRFARSESACGPFQALRNDFCTRFLTLNIL